MRTGGKGANYLGIGANTQYRIDQVTLVLRSVDIKTGHVLNSVSATKTIYSFLFNANIYKFIDFQKLVQSEFGYTTNEPAQMALKEAIELAVIQLTVDGIRDRHLPLKRPEDWSSPIIQFYAAADNANFADEAQPTKDFVPLRPRDGSRQRDGSRNKPFDAAVGLGMNENGAAASGEAQAAAESGQVTKPVSNSPVRGVQPIPPASSATEAVAKPAVVESSSKPANSQSSGNISATPPPVSQNGASVSKPAVQPAAIPLGVPEADDIFQSYWRKR